MRGASLVPPYFTWQARESSVVREALERSYERLIHRTYGAQMREWLADPAATASAQARRMLASACNVRLVSPLMDRAVLSYCLALPQDMILDGAMDKPFLREALVGRIPEEVRRREKDDRLFKLLLRRTLTSASARELLGNERVRERLRTWVRFDRVEALLDEIRAGAEVSIVLLAQLSALFELCEWYPRANQEFGLT